MAVPRLRPAICFLFNSDSNRDGSLSNTLRFRSFQRHHAPRIMRESKPLRRTILSWSRLCNHQSRNDVPGCGARRSRSMGASTLYHTSLANTQPPTRCCAVSCSWSQSAHTSSSYNPRRFLLAAVQSRSCSCNQKKNFHLGGARAFHSSFAPLRDIIPMKKALYAEEAEYIPSAVQRQMNLLLVRSSRSTPTTFSHMTT